MRFFVVLLVTSLALTACGRRGALEPPPGAAAIEQQGEQQGIPQSGATTGMATAEEKPDLPFVLDPLI